MMSGAKCEAQLASAVMVPSISPECLPTMAGEKQILQDHPLSLNYAGKDPEEDLF